MSRITRSAPGPRSSGGSASIVGLFAPPLLAATAVGAVIGAGVGKAAHSKIEAGIKAGAEDAIPIGGAALIVAYHPASGAAVEAAVTRAIKRSIGRGHRPAQDGAEGGDGRRPGEAERTCG